MYEDVLGKERGLIYFLYNNVGSQKRLYINKAQTVPADSVFGFGKRQENGKKMPDHMWHMQVTKER